MGKGKGGIRLLMIGWGILVLALGRPILSEIWEQNKIYQSILPLGELEYNQAFLDKAEKIHGICALSPVAQLPVQMRIGEYRMDTEFLGVNLEEMTVRTDHALTITLGNSPVLLLGEDALVGLQDRNGHKISEDQKKKLLEHVETLEAEYCITGNTEEGKEIWLPCRIAAVLSDHEENIYLPYQQALKLRLDAGLSEQTEKVLLTVRGAKNMQKAEQYLGS